MPTIADIASGEDFSVLLGAITFIDGELPDAKLAETLSNPGSFTVFAPTNAAFGALAADLGFAGDPADADAVLAFLAGAVPVETLRDVVLYHVLGSEQFAADIAANPVLTTLQGGTITADGPTLVDAEPDLIDPSLVATDIDASNGVVHVINRVLLPIDLPGNDAPTITGIALASGTGFDANGQDFDILREAVVAAGLAGALDDPDADLTVFAPNDAAFVGLAQTLGYHGDDEAGAFGHIVGALRLLSKGDDPIPLLEAILLYHVAPESLQASQVLLLDQIPTLLGADLGREGATLVDAEPDLADPSLIATDIQAANGVVHVIDGVLIPADLLPSDGSNDVDFILAGDGNDRIWTGKDNDWIDGGGGHDLIRAGKGDDVVLGGDGRDYLIGGKGDDHVAGEADNDLLAGRQGDDDLSGGDGHDRLYGGFGDDLIDGGAGDDRLFGGRGNDTFVFADDGSDDVVFDFDRGRGDDKIDLTAFGFEDFSQVENHIQGRFFGTQIDLGATDIFLVGVRAHRLTEDDFLL